MSQEHESVSDKLHDAAEKLNDKLEPDGSAHAGRQLGNDASDPFSTDQRPDETDNAHESVAGAEQHHA